MKVTKLTIKNIGKIADTVIELNKPLILFYGEIRQGKTTIMRLSSELSALYPEGFGLDLIDRGESLGKSIFEFVERAKREEKTIMATIVGEKPASVPENVGVFVVQDGKVSA